MNISVDHFLRIGSSHQICEDYVISGSDPVPYVILSDGCSSSKDTDVGARILAQCAKSVLKLMLPVNDLVNSNFKSAVIFKADIVRRALGLSRRSLDATLIVMFSQENCLHVCMFGDGFFFEIGPRGETVYNLSYPNSMPFYLNYYNDEKELKTYKDLNIVPVVTWGGLNKGQEGFLRPPEGPLYFKREILPNSTYLISSDGMGSFIQDGQNPDSTSIWKEMTSFKNTTGEFIKRRCKRALGDLEKQGVKHYDDLSIGGFFIGE
jgi:hypothetical protein